MKKLRRYRSDRKPWNTVSKRVSGKRIGAKEILQERNMGLAAIGECNPDELIEAVAI